MRYIVQQILMMKKLLVTVLFLFVGKCFFAQSLPDGFTDVDYMSGWSTVLGIDFDEKGRMYAWEKSGKVTVVENGVKSLLLDISEEVTNFRDHGMLGFVLDPDFYKNGYFYVYYALDMHYYRHFGTAAYHPDSTTINQASLGRVARFTADPNSDFKSTLPESKKILIGEDLGSGVPILFHSHDGGTLLFGDDGSLLLSTGDGATHQHLDRGGDVSYAPQALADGLIHPAEDVGAYRSQQLHSLNGKVLRIDPQTGDGLPGNPFFDPAAPRANISRVYALGLRNPFRMQLHAGTGSHYIADGDPGHIYIADVGNWEWEEFNLLKEGGANFGWPFFEGIDTLRTFFADTRENLFAPNPHYNPASCNREYFTFQELLHEAQMDSSHAFINPCNPFISIKEDHPVFFHKPPLITYRNERKPPTRTVAPGFDANGDLIPIDLHLPEAPFVSDTFSGACASAVVIYDGNNFPEEYRGKLFMGDCVGNWIRTGEIDPETGELKEVKLFHPQTKNIVCMAVNPQDGCLYYVSYSQRVRQICYGGNVAPDVVLSADTFYGPGPLSVQFSSEGSRDQNGDSVSYFWDFGDGKSSSEEHPQHTFSTENDDPQAFEVILTLTDSAGLSKSESLIISLNNSPPDVQITSFQDGDLYSTTETSWLPLQAHVEDAEHSDEMLTYSWETFVHHNTHFHPEAADPRPSSTALISPVGCGDEDFYYRIRLTVSDPAGLSRQVEHSIYPYCGPEIVEFGELLLQNEDDLIQLDWSSLHEYKTTQMVVERYGETTGFQPVGELEAAGDNMGTLSYRFQDLSPINGENRYRIRTVSEQGVYAYSEQAVAIWPPPQGMDIFPNPVKDVLRVHFRKIEEEASVILTDLTGKILFQRKWDDTAVGIHTIYLQNLQPGVYFYNLNNGEEELAGKLVKR